MPISPVHSGKVRELYAVGDDKLLMVASDRISAFDVILAEPIPDKGRVLTAMTAYWLGVLSDVAPSHSDQRRSGGHARSRRPRSGRIFGYSGSVDAREASGHAPARMHRQGLSSPARRGRSTSASSTVHGTALPKGMRQAERLDQPMFTPSTKAEEGHDVNLSFAQAVEPGRVTDVATRRATSVSRHTKELRPPPKSKGILVADTKFELGWIDGKLSLLRRGAHPGLLTVLAGGGSNGYQSRPLSTSSRCATGSRKRLGQAATASAPVRRDRGRDERSL